MTFHFVQIIRLFRQVRITLRQESWLCSKLPGEERIQRRFDHLLMKKSDMKLNAKCEQLKNEKLIFREVTEYRISSLISVRLWNFKDGGS